MGRTTHLSGNTTRYLSRLLVFVIVATGTQATVSAQTWSAPVMVENAAGTGGITGKFTSLQMVDGHPAVAYYDETHKNLMFVRALDAAGTTWGLPVFVDVAGDVGQDASLQIVNGNPAIAYYDHSPAYIIKYVRATDALGTGWGAPVPVEYLGYGGFYPVKTSLHVVNGNPAISYWGGGGAGAGLKYVRATNASGTTWGVPISIESTGTVGYHPDLQIVNGNPAIAYHHQTNTDLKYVRATDASGTTWATPVIVDNNNGYYPSLREVDGRPAISYSTNTGLKYARATDATGTAWGTPLAVDATGQVGAFSSLHIVGGNPAISYYDQTNTNLKYVRATDASGTTWATGISIDVTGTVGQYASMQIVSGNPAISYYDDTNGDLKYVRATDPTGIAWGTPIFIDAPPDLGRYPSAKIVNGNPAISYGQAFGGLKYVRALDPSGSTWAAPAFIDVSGNVGQFTSLQTVSGNPGISYFDSDNGDLKYVRATDVSGSTWASPTSIDATGYVGQFTSLQMVNGHPAISYYDVTNGNLKYVRATNAEGTAWATPVPIDVAGDVGQYTSLQVVDGNPAISYYDVTNANLKFVRATDASGTTWGTPVTIHATGNVGQYASLQIVNGNPAVSFYDATNGELKYMRASDTAGTTWPTIVIIAGFSGNGGQHISLQIINGNPAVSYDDGSYGFKLQYIRAYDTDGFSWPEYPVVLANYTIFGSNHHSSMIPMGSGVGIAYYHPSELFPYFVYGGCVDPGLPTVTSAANYVCPGGSMTLSVAGDLNSAYYWRWYKDACGVNYLGDGSDLTVWPMATTTYYVRGEGNCILPGICASITITLSSSGPPQPGAISGNALICAGSGNTYRVDPVNTASNYLWTLPGGWTGTSTTNSITTTSNTSSGNVSVVATNSCGQSIARSLTVATSAGLPAVPGPISGNTSVCPGTSNTYSITSGGEATSYTWTLPVSWTGSSTTNSITAAAGTGGGNIKVTRNNACGASPEEILAVTINLPPQPDPIDGNENACSGGSHTYSIADVPGATAYVWTLPGGWTGSSTTNSITVDVGATGGDISVAATSSCGSSSEQTKTIDVTTVPAQPGVIDGSTSICSGNATTYTIAAVNGATSYLWALPNGWTGSSTSTSITVEGTASGDISVRANSTCGSSSWQMLTVEVNEAPATPGLISGNAQICAGSANTYTVASVSGATNYVWMLPDGWTGISASNSITAVAGPASGNVLVKASNACGLSSQQAISVAVISVPAQPAAIEGNTVVCVGSSNSFSLTPVDGATGYTWTLPESWTGTSTTNSIQTEVSLPGGFISATADNLCGSSPARTIQVTVNQIPSQPGAVDGDVSICSGTSHLYSIAGVSGATSYGWTLPDDWTGTSATTSILTFASATAGTISVVAKNDCGFSAARTLFVEVGSPPAQPGAISGSSTICLGTSNTYTIAEVSGAASYTWTLPANWTGSSTTHSISVSATAGAGDILVAASNACGLSPAASIAVEMSTPEKPVITASTGGTPVLTSSSDTGNQWFLNGVAIAGATGKVHTVVAKGSYQVAVTINGCTSDLSDAKVFVVTGDHSPKTFTAVRIYPNPAEDLLWLDLSAFESGEEVTIVLVDAVGRVRQSRIEKGGVEIRIELADYPAGIYLMRMSQGNIFQVGRFVKK